MELNTEPTPGAQLIYLIEKEFKTKMEGLDDKLAKLQDDIRRSPTRFENFFKDIETILRDKEEAEERERLLNAPIEVPDPCREAQERYDRIMSLLHQYGISIK